MSLEVGGASRSGLVVPGARKPGPSRRGHVFHNFWTHQKETFLYFAACSTQPERGDMVILVCDYHDFLGVIRKLVYF